MRLGYIYTVAFLTVLFPFALHAQEEVPDVFDVFAESVTNGNARELEPIMENSLEIDLIDEILECSKVQAVHIMEMFFMKNTPQSFTILHRSGRNPMKYAIGEMSTGDEIFRITVFVGTSGSRDRIQQLRIEKVE